MAPTRRPTTRRPTPQPTRIPTPLPTRMPTPQPTPRPTSIPTQGPLPIRMPTPQPTLRPTSVPTQGPLQRPPTGAPVSDPTPEPQTCAEVCLTVSQGGRMLAAVQPIETEDRIQDFYDYENGNASFNGEDVISERSQVSQIMIHGNGLDCQLSLLILHDSRRDGSGGSVQMDVTGDLSDAIVRDDPGDSYLYSPAVDTTRLSWEWSSCCTDGAAHILEEFSPNDCITIQPNFISGIDRWVFVRGPASDVNPVTEANLIDLNPNVSLQICRVSESCPRIPTEAPMDQPTRSPTFELTLFPAQSPTPAPVNPLSPAPVMPLTPAPVNPPTLAPVNQPTPAPVNPPTPAPMSPPTPAPVNPPTPAPVSTATPAPVVPPTPAPVSPPTPSPVVLLTSAPTIVDPIPPPPTPAPVNPPTVAPVLPPTAAPVVSPTAAPVVSLTPAPVVSPTTAPVNPPTATPVVPPTPAPVNPPTPAPVVTPTPAPVNPPTAAPVVQPSPAPVNPPTAAPVVQPTPAPVSPPTAAPVVQPTLAPVVAPTPAPAPMTLLFLIQNTEEFSILNTAIQAADNGRNSGPLIAELLGDPNASLTAFAPINGAFTALEAIAPGYLNQLLLPAFSMHLFDILLYHITNGRVVSADFPIMDLEMLASGTIDISANGMIQSVSPDIAQIQDPPDFEAENGIAQVISDVLLPEFVTRNVLTSLQASPETFSSLLRLIEAAQLEQTIAGLNGVTFLAPTNDAIQAETEEFLLMEGNEDILLSVLSYHIVTSVINCVIQSVPNILLVESLQGETIVVGLIFDQNEEVLVSFNQATRLGERLTQQNIIYEVSTILVPPTLSTIVPRDLVLLEPEIVVEASTPADGSAIFQQQSESPQMSGTDFTDVVNYRYSSWNDWGSTDEEKNDDVILEGKEEEEEAAAAEVQSLNDQVRLRLSSWYDE